jgi:membrane fusion protein (multidrug efflux system)
MIRNIIALGLLGLAACSNGEGAERERNAPLVNVAPATTMRFVDTIEAVGTARAEEQVTLSAPVTERLVRLNFEDGDYVTRGQTIAVLAAAETRRRRGRARRSSSSSGSRR